MNITKNKNNIICIILFIFLCIWFIPNYTKGIDLSDTFFSITKYKYVSNSNYSLTNFSTLFTDIVGGFIYSLAPSHHLLILNLCNAVCYTINSLLLIYLFKEYLPKTLLFFIAIICNWYSLSNMHIFNYNTTTIFILTLSVFTFLRALKNDNHRLLMLSGFLTAINIFFRMPNVLHLIIFLGIFRYYFICKKSSFITSFQYGLYYIAGMVSAFIIGLLCSVSILGYDNVKSIIIKTFKTFFHSNQANSNSHNATSMFSHLYLHFRHIVKNWYLYLLIIICIIFLLLLFSNIRNNRNKKSNALFKFIGMALGIILAVYANIRIMETNYLPLIFWSLLILSSFCFSLYGCLYFVHKNHLLSTYCFINIVLILVLPIGTDVAFLYYIYFLCFPMFTMLSVMKHITPVSFQIKQVSLTFESYRVIACFIITILIINGYYFSKTYVYRDSSYKNLTAPVEIPELKGMYTTPKRAKILETLYQYLEPYQNYEIATLGDCNVIPVITDMKCFFSVPWPDLNSFSHNTFITELNNKTLNHNYPVIVLAPFSAIYAAGSDSVYRSPEKYNALMELITSKHYKTLFKDQFIEIYVPVIE